MDVLAGSTDVTTYFHLRLAADGLDATGLTITGMDLQYTRSGAAPSAKVDATALAATDSAHGDNQAIEVDATDQPGVYRIDWPDAAFAAGAREVILTVKVATAFTESLRVNLTPVPANMTEISGSGAAADNLEDSSLTIYRGEVTSGTPTTTTLIDSGLTQAGTDHWKGRVIIFRTGTLAKQATDITAFDPATDELTFSALSAAPTVGDFYVIV